MHNKQSAEDLAKSTLEEIIQCITSKTSFLFDAGAGAGKTETLKKALEHLVTNEGKTLRSKSMAIACVTYTKVAANEIKSRVRNDPLIHVSTIHSFVWEAIKAFQPHLRSALPDLTGWPERISEHGPLDNKPVFYRDSYPRITNTEVEIGHNDVLMLMVHLMSIEKFRDILTARFPYIFIDEYQDSDANLIAAIKSHFLDKGEGPVFGFFGDSWQKIYTGVCGAIEHPELARIPALSNFRSAPCIVEALNRMRPDLPQAPSRSDAEGEIIVFHTNDWPDQRRSGGHWAGDLEAEAARRALQQAEKELANRKWNLSPHSSRKLLLTHSLMGREQGYETITSKLKRDDYEELKNPILFFLHSHFETARRAFGSKSYGEMFSALGHRVQLPKSYLDKADWVHDMKKLENLCMSNTVGDVLESIKSSPHIPIPQDIERLLEEHANWDPNALCLDDRLAGRMQKCDDLLNINYSEVIALSNYHRQLTGFKTQHGVKGDQFPTVIVALGRGWNLYNTDKYLSWFSQGIPHDKQESFERTRNLFYVACSRAEDRLSLLITQRLSTHSMDALVQIFGPESIVALPPNLDTAQSQ